MDGHLHPGPGGASDFHLVPTGCKENTPGDRTAEAKGVKRLAADLSRKQSAKRRAQSVRKNKPRIYADRNRRRTFLTADPRRLPQIRIRIFHRRDAEYAKKSLLAQSGDDDWAKTSSSNLKNVFVCRRLPTNKHLIFSAVCDRLRVSAANNSLHLASWRDKHC